MPPPMTTPPSATSQSGWLAVPRTQASIPTSMASDPAAAWARPSARLSICIPTHPPADQEDGGGHLQPGRQRVGQRQAAERLPADLPEQRREKQAEDDVQPH